MDVLESASHGEVVGSAEVFHDGWVGLASGDRIADGFHAEGAAPEWTALGGGPAHIQAGESAGRPLGSTDWRKKNIWP